MKDIQEIIERLQLLPHPEGGFYRETYRSNYVIPAEVLPAGFSGNRSGSTAIYFLLPVDTFSAFHSISSDECWQFYEGLPVHIVIIQPNGALDVIKRGNNAEQGEVYQAVVPAHCWFASRPVGDSGYSLAGCTVAPGFDFADFKMAGRNVLVKQFPQHEKIIWQLTR